MRKQITKKLYTYYTVFGKLDDIRNNPAHHLVSYSDGKAECIKYHNNFTSWITEITCGNFENGFGIKFLTEDGKDKVTTHLSNYECNTYTCKNKSEDYIGRIMGDIIKYYFNTDLYYYEIEHDNIYTSKELTGHIYYRSPYESCDNCGTCDGARCNSCKEKYIVRNLDTEEVLYDGYDKAVAERIEKESKRDYTNIISDILNHYDIRVNWFKEEINEASDDKALFRILNEYKIPYYCY